ncbi:MAG: hypothetical protein EPO08_20730 [Rhodospirillaceae bacterium]|nr:MAG: hypothetical protein EPO08_20730 [Rhodospirillaceae bacterium]
MYKVDPAQEFAAFVNAMIAPNAYMRPAAILRQVIVAFPGDPLAGKTIPGSGLMHNAATTVQQLIEQWYESSGKERPAGYGKMLALNAGPHEPWNYSYDDWAALGVLVY